VGETALRLDVIFDPVPKPETRRQRRVDAPHHKECPERATRRLQSVPPDAGSAEIRGSRSRITVRPR
jgi:hypothetical protein